MVSFVVAPHIADAWSSDDVIVEEGDDVTLVCNATGEPQPQVTWRRRQATPTTTTLPLITEHHRCQLSHMTAGKSPTSTFIFVAINLLKLYTRVALMCQHMYTVRNCLLMQQHSCMRD